MKRIHTILLSTVALILSLQATAQEDTTQQTSIHFTAGLFYNSHLNYLGRTDSLRSSAVFPFAELTLNGHFYINAAPVFIHNNTGMEYAGLVATAGYRFKHKEDYSGNFYFTKPLYKQSSDVVQSALKGQFTANFSWLNKIINISWGGDIRLSDKVDYGVSAGIDHIYRHEFHNKFVLVADPTVNAYAGTQQFTNTYYKQNNLLFLPGIEQQVTEKVNQFNVLAYEFSVPIVVAKGKWQWLVIPSCIIPQHVIASEGNTKAGNSLFYCTAGIKVVL